MGGRHDAFGVPLPDSSLETCLKADSVLLGAVGGPKWDDQPPPTGPEQGLLKLRGMKLYTNVRPAGCSPSCPTPAPSGEISPPGASTSWWSGS